MLVKFGVRPLRPGRRIRQPRHQSHGAVSQPGHARAGQLLAAHVSSLLGPDDDSAQHLRPQHAARLPYPGTLRARADLARTTTSSASPASFPTSAKCARCAASFAGSRPTPNIVVGGHVAAIPGLDKLIDADYVVRGEGIAWMRRYLGEDPDAPIEHPEILSGFGMRVLGMRVPDNTRDTAATIIPSVGCPMGCNFCTTSAFFGGKGKSVNFYEIRRRDFRSHGAHGALHECAARSSSWTKTSCSIARAPCNCWSA